MVMASAGVQRGGQGLFVYLVGADKTVAQRPVKLGPAEGQDVAVTDGLAAGDLVVVDGMDRLRPGASVEVASARPEIKPPADAKGSSKGAGTAQRRRAGGG